MAAGWHLFSAIVIGPALVVLNKLPNRSGSKRVKILSKLLIWLLVNGLFAATQNIGIISGLFHPPKNLDETGPPIRSPRNTLSHSGPTNVHLSQLSYQTVRFNYTTPLEGPEANNCTNLGEIQTAQDMLRYTTYSKQLDLLRHNTNCDNEQQQHLMNGTLLGGQFSSTQPTRTTEMSKPNGDNKISAQGHRNSSLMLAPKDPLEVKTTLKRREAKFSGSSGLISVEQVGPQLNGGGQLANTNSKRHNDKQEYAPVVFICWIVSVSIIIVSCLIWRILILYAAGGNSIQTLTQFKHQPFVFAHSSSQSFIVKRTRNQLTKQTNRQDYWVTPGCLQALFTYAQCFILPPLNRRLYSLSGLCF